MGDIIPFAPADPERRVSPRRDVIDAWASAWTDSSLTPLQAYETGMLLGERCAGQIADNYVASQWLLAELLEMVPHNGRQHAIRSGLVDAVTRALARSGSRP
jgi:hypothetical protein